MSTWTYVGKKTDSNINQKINSTPFPAGGPTVIGSSTGIGYAGGSSYRGSYGGGSSPAPLRAFDSATLANVRSLQSQGFNQVQIQQVVERFTPQELSQRIAGQVAGQDVQASVLLSRISQKKLQEEYESGVKAPLEDYKSKEEAFLESAKRFEASYGGRGLTEQEYARALQEQKVLQQQQEELNRSFSTLRLTEKVEQARAKQTAIDRQLQQQRQLAGQASVSELIKSGAGVQRIPLAQTDSRVISSKSVEDVLAKNIITREAGASPAFASSVDGGKKIVEKTPLEKISTGQFISGTSSVQEGFEKQLSKDKEIRLDVAGGLLLSSVAVGASSIIEPGARILAPTLQRGDLLESGKRLGSAVGTAGGILLVAGTQPIQTVVGVGRMAISRPIQFTGELIGTAGAFKGLGKIVSIPKSLIGKVGTKLIPAKSLTQPKVLASVEAGKMTVPTSATDPFKLAKQFSTGKTASAKALGQPFGGISVSGEKLFSALKKKLPVGFGKSEFFQPGFYISSDASFGFARLPAKIKSAFDLSKIKISVFPKSPSPSAVFVKAKVGVSKQLVGKSLIEQAKAFGFDVSKLRPDIQKYLVKESRLVELGKGKVTNLKIKFLEEKFGAKEISKAFSEPTLPKGQGFITGKRLMGSPEIEAVIPSSNVLSIVKDKGILSSIKGYKFRTSVSGVDIPIFITEPSVVSKGVSSVSSKLSKIVDDVRLKRAISSSRDFESGVTYVPLVSSKSLGFIGASIPKSVISGSSSSSVQKSVSSLSVSSSVSKVSGVSLTKSSVSVPSVSKLSSPSSVSSLSVGSSSGLPRVSNTSFSSSVSKPSVSSPGLINRVSRINISSYIKNVSKPSYKPVISRSVSKITPRPITPKPIITNISVPKFGSVSFGSKKKGLLDVFDVEVRKKGKFVKVASALPRGLAKRVGIKVTGETIARTFRLTRIGAMVTKDVPLPKLDQYRLPKGRSSLKGPFTFVEKSKFAIDSPTEKRTLREARRLKRVFNY